MAKSELGREDKGRPPLRQTYGALRRFDNNRQQVATYMIYRQEEFTTSKRASWPLGPTN